MLQSIDMANRAASSAVETGSGARWHRADAVALALLLVWVAVCYAQTLSFGFVNWDDFDLVLKNPLVINPSSVPLLHRLTTPEAGYPIPVTSLSYPARILARRLRASVATAWGERAHPPRLGRFALPYRPRGRALDAGCCASRLRSSDFTRRRPSRSRGSRVAKICSRCSSPSSPSRWRCQVRRPAAGECFAA